MKTMESEVESGGSAKVVKGCGILFTTCDEDQC